jgi:hypothetical protein
MNSLKVTDSSVNAFFRFVNQQQQSSSASQFALYIQETNRYDYYRIVVLK